MKEFNLFTDSLTHKFSSGIETIKAEPVETFVKHIKFSDEMLDRALKIPQVPRNARFKLVYEYIDRNVLDSSVIDSNWVIKCTYWQTPIFDREEEAISLGVSYLNIDGKVYGHTKSTSSPFSIPIKFTYFTDRYGMLDFNESKFLKNIMNKEVAIPTYMAAFRRQYGGIYSGISSKDANKFDRKFPYEVFGKIGDYQEKNLFGTTLDQDFANIREFIHYTFDPTKSNECFESFKRNSEYYIMLVCETDTNAEQYVNKLRSVGYRADFVKTNRFDKMEEYVGRFAPIKNLEAFITYINNNIDSLNFVLKNNGFYAFSPQILEAEAVNIIKKDLCAATNKDVNLFLSFNCDSKQFYLLSAPFSKAILVFTDFTKETQNVVIDSIKAEHHIIKIPKSRLEF
jgi:hypothetical protein